MSIRFESIISIARCCVYGLMYDALISISFLKISNGFIETVSLGAVRPKNITIDFLPAISIACSIVDARPTHSITLLTLFYPVSGQSIFHVLRCGVYAKIRTELFGERARFSL